MNRKLDKGDVLDKNNLKAFDLLTHAVWIFDIERQSMWFANSEAILLWESDSLENLINRDWASDMSKATQTRLNDYLIQFEKGETVDEQWTFYPNGQAPVTVNCLCSGVRIEDGRLAMLLEARKVSTADIHPDELRGIEALRHTSVNISQYDMDGKLLFRNPAATKTFGDRTDFHSLFESSEDADQVWRSVAQDSYHTGKYRFRTTNGTVWHGIDSTQTVDPITASPAILVNQKDIHSEWWSESILDWYSKVLDQIAINEPLQALLETIVEMTEATEPELTCCILLLEPGGTYIRCAAAPTLPGDVVDALTGLKHSVGEMTFGGAAFSGEVAITEDILADANWALHHQLARRANLRACWSVPIQDPNGNSFGSFVAFYSSPKRPENRQLELLEMASNLVELAIKRHDERQELIGERERAEKANQAKSEFLSTMSHELRTPLTASIGSLGMLNAVSAGKLSEQGIELIEIASRNNKTLLHLVNELLDFEKILSGTFLIKTSCHDASLLTKDIVRDLKGYAASQDVTFVFIKPSCPCYIDVQEHRFAQILGNLLSNAAKYSDPQTHVTISIECEDSSIVIAIQDRGPGIPKEFQDRIYDQFTQADSSSTRRHRGTGLGLTISKALAEGMGGSLSFESEINVGTIFRVRFPEFVEL